MDCYCKLKLNSALSLPSHSLELLEEVAVDHRDLVDDEVFGLPPLGAYRLPLGQLYAL